MKNMNKASTNKNIKAIIINKDRLEMDELSIILTKHEEFEVAGIINPIEQSVPAHILRRVHYGKDKSDNAFLR